MRKKTPPIVRLLATHIKGKTRWSKKDAKVLEAYAGHVVTVAELFASKHHDYGTGNVAATGQLGQLVKILEKAARLSNLFRTARKAKNESKFNSLADISNHCLIGLMLMAGDWPDVEDGWEI